MLVLHVFIFHHNLIMVDQNIKMITLDVSEAQLDTINTVVGVTMK